MNITFNGKPCELAESMNVRRLVGEKGFNPERVVVELNGALLGMAQWDAAVLKENDTVEVLSFVGGG